MIYSSLNMAGILMRFYQKKDIFSEMSNETEGEHYTPREVIRLMVNILFAEHKEELKKTGLIRSVFDPACGTGGMLTVAIFGQLQ
jgi:type I restriction-modification system DNA methylase subunit